MRKTNMGKGSKQRPIQNKDKFNENWQKIFEKKKPSSEIPTKVQQN